MNNQQPQSFQFENQPIINEGFNYPTLLEEPTGILQPQQNQDKMQQNNNQIQRYSQQNNAQLYEEQQELNKVLKDIGLNEKAIEEQKNALQQYQRKRNSDFEMINQQNQIQQQMKMYNQGNFIIEIDNAFHQNQQFAQLSPQSQNNKNQTTTPNKILSGILVNLEKQKITMLIKACTNDSKVFSQCCFIRNQTEQFYQPTQRKQTFVIDKTNGDLFVFNNMQLLHFIPDGQNWLTVSHIINFKPENYQLKLPILHILQDPIKSIKYLLIIEFQTIIVIEISTHQIIKSLVMPEMKSRPILFSDKNYFYIIGGKENPQSALKISLSQFFQIKNPLQDIEIIIIPIKFEQWGITKSSVHDAVIVESKGHYYILGRRQQKALQFIISKNNLIVLKYAENDYLKLNEKTYFTESNVHQINSKQLIFLTEDLQTQIIKSMKL